MLNRRSGNPFGSFIVLIMIGIVVGIGYVIFDNVFSGGSDENPPVTEVASDAPIESTVMPIAPTPSAPEVATIEPTPTARVQLGPGPDDEAQIIIPSAAINAPVIRVFLDGSSWDVSQLGTNVGHLQGTTWFNSVPGNIVLSGHVELSDGRRGVFADLNTLEIGDRVILREGEREVIYAVTEIRNVEPTNLDPIRPTTSERITLRL